MTYLEDEYGAKNLVYRLLKLIEESIEFRILINSGKIPSYSSYVSLIFVTNKSIATSVISMCFNKNFSLTMSFNTFLLNKQWKNTNRH